MSILWMVVIGLAIGILAKVLLPARDAGGSMSTIVLGIAGSVLAGVSGRSIGWYMPDAPVEFVSSVIGAVLILALFRVIKPRHARRKALGKAA